MIDADAPDGGLLEAAQLIAAQHGDPMRMALQSLSPEQSSVLMTIKALGTMLYGTVAELPRSREQALALTNLEQAVMWASKAVSARQPEKA